MASSPTGYPGERERFDPYAYNEEEVYDEYRRQGSHGSAAAERDRILRRRGAADRQRFYQFGEEELARAGSQEQRTAGSRQEYTDLLRGFNPMDYATMVAKGTYGELEGMRGKAEAGRRAGLNRRGLYGSNLGGGEEARMFNTSLARALGQGGFQAAELESGRIGRFGSLHEADRGEAFETRGRGYDLYAGAADRNQAELNARRQEEADRRNRPKWWETALQAAPEFIDAFVPG